MRYDKIERSVSTELWPVASRADEASIHTCRIIRPVVFFFSISEQHGDEMLAFLCRERYTCLPLSEIMIHSSSLKMLQYKRNNKKCNNMVTKSLLPYNSARSV